MRLNRNKSGFYTKEMVQRQKPFGTLASRTIGDIYGEIDMTTGVTKGKNGLELQYDTLLRGVAGTSAVRRVAGGWTNVVEVEPIEGMKFLHVLSDDSMLIICWLFMGLLFRWGRILMMCWLY